MTIIEMYEKVREIYEANDDDYAYIGLRFEEKNREIGEECEWSKDNPDREDERDFPKYGSEEYDDLPTLDGTSSWNASLQYPGAPSKRWVEMYRDKDAATWFASHAYVVAGNRYGSHPNPDDGEILIGDAVVIAKLF